MFYEMNYKNNNTTNYKSNQLFLCVLNFHNEPPVCLTGLTEKKMGG